MTGGAADLRGHGLLDREHEFAEIDAVLAKAQARATAAGLIPGDTGYLTFVGEYRDLATMARGYMAAAPFVRAARAAGEAAVRASLARALAPLQTSSGALPAHRRGPLPHRPGPVVWFELSSESARRGATRRRRAPAAPRAAGRSTAG